MARSIPLTVQQHVEMYSQCGRCSLSETRTEVVLGRGSLPAQILFLGEGPGITEDMTGRPFVGRSGRLLDEMIALAFKRAFPKDGKAWCTPTYYITNVVACRACDSEDGPNRKPTEEEMDACSGRLDQVVELVRPELIVTLGMVPKSRLEHIRNIKKGCNTVYLPHPAWLLRHGGMEYKATREAVRVLKVAVIKLRENNRVTV